MLSKLDYVLKQVKSRIIVTVQVTKYTSVVVSGAYVD